MKSKQENLPDYKLPILYVPGHKANYIESAMRFNVKNLLLCLEDGTPEDKKTEARYLVKNAMEVFTEQDKNILVRINSVHTEHWKKDIDEILKYKPTRIRVPLVHRKEDLLEIDDYINRKMNELKLDYSPVYEVMVESRQALQNISSIYGSCDRIYSFTFGGEDFYDDIKDSSDNPEQEVINAKQAICDFCKQKGIYCFDTTYMLYLNTEGFIKDTIRSKEMGFTSRSVIHPSQVKLCIEIYNS